MKFQSGKRSEPAQKDKQREERAHMQQRDISQADQDLQSGSDGGEAVLAGQPREGNSESPPPEMLDERDEESD